MSSERGDMSPGPTWAVLSQGNTSTRSSSPNMSNPESDCDVDDDERRLRARAKRKAAPESERARPQKAPRLDDRPPPPRPVTTSTSSVSTSTSTKFPSTLSQVVQRIMHTAHKQTAPARNVTTANLLRKAQQPAIDDSLSRTRRRPKLKQKRTNYAQEVGHERPLNTARQRVNGNVTNVDTIELTDSSDTSRRRRRRPSPSTKAVNTGEVIVISDSDDVSVPANRSTQNRPRVPPPSDVEIISVLDSDEDADRGAQLPTAPASTSGRTTLGVPSVPKPAPAPASAKPVATKAPAPALVPARPVTTTAPAPASAQSVLTTAPAPAPASAQPLPTTARAPAPASVPPLPTAAPAPAPASAPPLPTAVPAAAPTSTLRPESSPQSTHPSSSFEPPPDDFDDPLDAFNFEAAGDDGPADGPDSFGIGPSLATLPMTVPSRADPVPPSASEGAEGPTTDFFDSYMNMDQLAGDTDEATDEQTSGALKESTRQDNSVHMQNLDGKDAALLSMRTSEAPISKKTINESQKDPELTQQTNAYPATQESEEIRSQRPSRWPGTPEEGEIRSQQPRTPESGGRRLAVNLGTPEEGEIRSQQPSTGPGTTAPTAHTSSSTTGVTVTSLTQVPLSSDTSHSPSLSPRSTASQPIGRTRTMLMPDISSYKGVRFKRSLPATRENGFFSRALTGGARAGKVPDSDSITDGMAGSGSLPSTPAGVSSNDDMAQSPSADAHMQNEIASLPKASPMVGSPQMVASVPMPPAGSPMAVDPPNISTEPLQSPPPPPSTQPRLSSSRGRGLSKSPASVTRSLSRSSSFNRPFIAPPRVPRPDEPKSLADLFNELHREGVEANKQRRELARKRSAGKIHVDLDSKEAPPPLPSQSEAQAPAPTPTPVPVQTPARPSPLLSRPQRRAQLPAPSLARPSPLLSQPQPQPQTQPATPSPVPSWSLARTPSLNDIRTLVARRNVPSASQPVRSTSLSSSTSVSRSGTEKVETPLTISATQVPTASGSTLAAKRRVSSIIPFEAFISPVRPHNSPVDKGKGKEVARGAPPFVSPTVRSRASTQSQRSWEVPGEAEPGEGSYQPGHGPRKSESAAFAAYIVRDSSSKAVSASGPSRNPRGASDGPLLGSVTSSLPLRAARPVGSVSSLEMSHVGLAFSPGSSLVSAVVPRGGDGGGDGDGDGADGHAENVRTMDVDRNGPAGSTCEGDAVVRGGETDETETLSQLASTQLSLKGAEAAGGGTMLVDTLSAEPKFSGDDAEAALGELVCAEANAAKHSHSVTPNTFIPDDDLLAFDDLPSTSREPGPHRISHMRNPSGDSIDECNALLEERDECEVESEAAESSRTVSTGMSLVPSRALSRSPRDSAERPAPSASVVQDPLRQPADLVPEYPRFTWASWVADQRQRAPRFKLARDLPHSLQDFVNAMPAWFRHSDLGRKVFEGHIREAMANEPDAPPIEIFDNGIGTESTPPWEFHYTNEIWFGDGVPPPDIKNLESCDCVGRCNPKSGKCACARRQQAWLQRYIDADVIPRTWPGSPFVYDHRGLLQRLECPIFECNQFCRCDEDCPNRVVQNGRKWPVHIAKTEHKGWGVFAGNKKIPKGSYIGVYAGELLREQEADERGKYYDLYGRTYLFSIDFHHLKMGMDREEDWENLYVVDAYHAGNLTRFLNHSCDPNAKILACHIDDADINKPLMVVFTTREVDAWEELCFSYYGDIDEKREEIEQARIAGEDGTERDHAVYAQCRCEADNCIGRLFS